LTKTPLLSYKETSGGDNSRQDALKKKPSKLETNHGAIVILHDDLLELRILSDRIPLYLSCYVFVSAHQRVIGTLKSHGQALKDFT
jgi:hypothetical protein